MFLSAQCRQRWQKAIKPGLLKGKWSPSEDEILKHLVSLNLGNWAEVALKLPGRTSKQCRERWCHHLSPNVNKSKFTDIEDKMIVELHKINGNKWAKIAADMKTGRTENMVRSRFKKVTSSSKDFA